jgi:hypothetical protein
MAGSLAFAAFAALCLAGFFAAAVDLFKEMAHDPDQGCAEAEKQEDERDRAPKRSVSGQVGLEA